MKKLKPLMVVAVILSAGFLFVQPISARGHGGGGHGGGHGHKYHVYSRGYGYVSWGYPYYYDYDYGEYMCWSPGYWEDDPYLGRVWIPEGWVPCY